MCVCVYCTCMYIHVYTNKYIHIVVDDKMKFCMEKGEVSTNEVILLN